MNMKWIFGFGGEKQCIRHCANVCFLRMLPFFLIEAVFRILIGFASGYSLVDMNFVSPIPCVIVAKTFHRKTIGLELI